MTIVLVAILCGVGFAVVDDWHATRADQPPTAFTRRLRATWRTHDGGMRW